PLALAAAGTPGRPLPRASAVLAATRSAGSTSAWTAADSDMLAALDGVLLAAPSPCVDFEATSIAVDASAHVRPRAAIALDDGTSWSVLREPSGLDTKWEAGVARLAAGEALLVGTAGANVELVGGGASSQRELPLASPTDHATAIARIDGLGVLIGTLEGNLI